MLQVQNPDQLTCDMQIEVHRSLNLKNERLLETEICMPFLEDHEGAEST
jgi:hypothetical protein